MPPTPATTLRAIDARATDLATQLDAECAGDHWPASHATFLRQSAFMARCLAEMAAVVADRLDGVRSFAEWQASANAALLDTARMVP